MDDLIKKLDFVNLLQEVFLSKDEEIIVPLALIASELGRRKEEKPSKNTNGFTKVEKNIMNAKSSLKLDHKNNENSTQYLKRVFQSMAKSQSQLPQNSKQVNSVKRFMVEKIKNIFEDFDLSSVLLKEPQEIKLSFKAKEKMIDNEIGIEIVDIEPNLGSKEKQQSDQENLNQKLKQSPTFSSPSKPRKKIFPKRG